MAAQAGRLEKCLGREDKWTRAEAGNGRREHTGELVADEKTGRGTGEVWGMKRKGYARRNAP